MRFNTGLDHYLYFFDIASLVPVDTVYALHHLFYDTSPKVTSNGFISGRQRDW